MSELREAERARLVRENERLTQRVAELEAQLHTAHQVARTLTDALAKANGELTE